MNSEERRERNRVDNRKYRRDNPTSVLKSRQRFAESHPGYSSEWRRLNPDRVKESRRKYKLSHPDMISAEQKRNRAKNHAYYSEYYKKYRETNGGKIRAQNTLNLAIKQGQIIPPDECSLCLRPLFRASAHHKDYSKPLRVVWLCKKCHYKIHHEGRPKK